MHLVNASIMVNSSWPSKKTHELWMGSVFSDIKLHQNLETSQQLKVTLGKPAITVAKLHCAAFACQWKKSKGKKKQMACYIEEKTNSRKQGMKK